MKTVFFSLLLVSCGVVFGDPRMNMEDQSKTKMMECPMRKAMVLRQEMRKLWSDHVIWTRGYIVATLAKSPDAADAAERLLKNQEDIGNTLQPYYGKDAAKNFTDLLKSHIAIAVDVVKAAMDQSSENLKSSQKKWQENSEAMADFLSTANPNLNKKDLLIMLKTHLKLTTDEVDLRLAKKWKEDVSNFDKIFDQALEMADTLAKGIGKQFFPMKPMKSMDSMKY